MSSPEVRNLIVGIYGRIAHNLVMYRITDRHDYLNEFLSHAAKILVQSNLPDEIIGEIINKAMEQSDLEYKMYLEGVAIRSFGGSEVTAESLIGFHCERLLELLAKD
ncbi:hypothetical protein SP15_166 [Bacillus phage SP-15]|uniref:Uncharacterized protein n=1 Tax=Bacillus phage SP-15 TaxID=1792032 RepID=A0A127AXK4_9CAUD|nr:hypothetical protein SP15_166 [Bacillus phage SP-15]AMM44964.1 hypothetical protein SP15_166 [Bacillus phage SP-15]